MTPKFYAHGKIFDNEEDFWKYSNDWPELPLDLEEFKHQMDIRIKEAEMNAQIRNGKLTNREAYVILRMSTDWVVDLPETEEL